VPKLWNDTIEAHRRAVRDATLDATAALVAAHGLASVTMSRIAEATGIGRATLYKYFRDVDAVLLAWHERQVHRHLHQLTEAVAQADDAAGRLRAVLEVYARICRALPAGDLATGLHRGAHVAHAQQHLREFVAGLLTNAVGAGDVRSDVPVHELAAYCLHALSAAGDFDSATGDFDDDAVRRLVGVTLSGLRP
jgi:AcrR family transcriptional regulator